MNRLQFFSTWGGIFWNKANSGDLWIFTPITEQMRLKILIQNLQLFGALTVNVVHGPEVATVPKTSRWGPLHCLFNNVFNETYIRERAFLWLGRWPLTQYEAVVSWVYPKMICEAVAHHCGTLPIWTSCLDSRLFLPLLKMISMSKNPGWGTPSPNISPQPCVLIKTISMPTFFCYFY